MLTPKGVEDKAKVTARFLRNKQAEYEALKQEIDQLKKEALKSKAANEPGSDTGSRPL